MPAPGTDLSPEASLCTLVPELCHRLAFGKTAPGAEVWSQLASAGIYRRHLKVTSILPGNRGGKVQQRMWTWVESNELGPEARRLQAESREVGGASFVSMRPRRSSGVRDAWEE